jgi:glycosyltransferase involved in cell wall biosynthesis
MEYPLYCSAPGRLTTTSAWHQHIPFAMYLIEALRPEVIVELGTHKGDSYCSFCQAVQELQLNARCFAVDTWQGDEQAGYFGSEVLEDLRAHHDPLYGSFSKLLQSSFDDALPSFEDGTIDLLHIDGFHTYAAVKHDLNLWLPKISRRGVVLLHDTNERDGDFGVWQLWDEVKREYPHFEFLHGHGLGVLGVGRQQSALLRELFQAAEEEIASIRKFFLQLGERLTLQAGSDAELEKLRQTNQEYRLQIKELTEYKLQLEMLRASRGWRAIQLLRRIREKVMPEGSRRRKAIRFFRRMSRKRISPAAIKKFLWYCRIYGFHNAVRLALRKLQQPDPSLQATIRPLSLPISTTSPDEEDVPLLDKKISIVVPTKNAGADFAILLRKLKSQKGLRECEIILVDSGSTDGTLELAINEGVRVIEISPESFNHAEARNRGAECATGDYVLFLVQDALPMTNTWLWEMAKTLEQNDVVAVSCAEYPRSDSDLFYQHVIWNHYRTFNLDKDRFLSWDESCSSPAGLRSNGQICDIAALIKLNIFSQYKFKAKFAEDLDLGIRLIKDGHRIGFLHTTRVLHSHNRPAFYFLKRAYVDTKFLKEFFPDFQFPSIDNHSRLFCDVAAIYCRTKSIAFEITAMEREERVSNFFAGIKSLYSVDHNEMDGFAAMSPVNEFESFVHSLMLSTQEQSIHFKCKENMLLPHFLQQLGKLQDFVSKSHDNVDENLIRDLAAALYKILALHCGAHMAYLYLTVSRQKPCEGFLAELDRQLVSGI